MVYVPKKTKVEVLEVRLLFKIKAFPKQVMGSVAISKTGQTSIFCCEPTTKVSVRYYCNVLLNKVIPEVNRLAKYNLLMQDGARAHTAKLILEMLKNKKKVLLLQPHHWLLNGPDLNPVDFMIWRLLFQNEH